jgi:hypothetical protein
MFNLFNLTSDKVIILTKKKIKFNQLHFSYLFSQLNQQFNY